MQVVVIFPNIVPIDPAGERPRSGGDIDNSSLFSNIARRFRTPPDMMTDVTAAKTRLALRIYYETCLECNSCQRSAQNSEASIADKTGDGLLLVVQEAMLRPENTVMYNPNSYRRCNFR
jgi:hypothetical protein